MKKEIIDIIKEKVAVGKNIPTAKIEYNFELPEDENITKESFFGVKAAYNENVPEGTAQLTYTM